MTSLTSTLKYYAGKRGTSYGHGSQSTPSGKTNPLENTSSGNPGEYWKNDNGNSRKLWGCYSDHFEKLYLFSTDGGLYIIDEDGTLAQWNQNDSYAGGTFSGGGGGPILYIGQAAVVYDGSNNQHMLCYTHS